MCAGRCAEFLSVNDSEIRGMHNSPLQRTPGTEEEGKNPAVLLCRVFLRQPRHRTACFFITMSFSFKTEQNISPSFYLIFQTTIIINFISTELVFKHKFTKCFTDRIRKTQCTSLSEVTKNSKWRQK